MQDHLRNFMQQLEAPSQIVPTGLVDLDKLIQGLQKGCLYTIAGGPSMGKTSLSLNIALNASSMFGKPTAFFSYEMTEGQIMSRLVSLECGIESSRILQRRLKDYEHQQIIDKIKSLNSVSLVIRSVSIMDIDELTTSCKELRKSDSIELFIIDDIQRVTIDEENRKYAVNREQEVSNNVRKLKALAIELDIPILIISQLNRQVESRHDKTPLLMDLRDSGAIENDSDVVIFIYRPERYGIQMNDEGMPSKGLAELIVSKNRHGDLGSATVSFKAGYSKFTDWEIENISSGFRSPFDHGNTF